MSEEDHASSRWHWPSPRAALRASSTTGVGVGVLAVLLGACGSDSSGLQGISCQKDSDCNPGLRCLSESLSASFFDADQDGGCESIGMVCLTTCSTDNDCNAALGPGYACLQGPCAAAVLACQPVVESADGGDGGGDASDGASDVTDAPVAP